MVKDVEYYEKRILEVLYIGFMKNPPYRVKNQEIEEKFGQIESETNFKIAREKLIQEGLIYGKNIVFRNPPYFQILGEGLIHYEKRYIPLSNKREYTVLILKFLTFLRDMGEKRYDISNLIEGRQTKIPRLYINEILFNDYDYEMNDLKWTILYFTSQFVGKHFMGINGIGITKDYLVYHNPDDFSLNLQGYNFINNFLSSEKSQKSNDELIDTIRYLLDLGECEYLDFKIDMYDIFSENNTTKWEQRQEFLKDVLSLINNKNFENIPDKAYILIGVGEDNGIYNGIHRNVEFTQFQTLIQLINRYITTKAKLNIRFEEYFIYGEKTNIIVSMNHTEGYNRNIIINLNYVIGTVYEIGVKIGNPNANVPYFHEGTSFTRDGSYARRLTQEDRRQIMSMYDEILEYEPDFIEKDEEETTQIKIDTDLIKNYNELLRTKKLSPTTTEDFLKRIKNQTRLLSYIKSIDDKEIKVLKEFIEFSCKFIRDKDKIINNLVFLILYELSSLPILISAIKCHCFDYLKNQFLEGNRYSYLIRLLNLTGYFENFIEDVFNAIDQRDFLLLDVMVNFEFNMPYIISNKWDLIAKLIDKKEVMDPEQEKRIIGIIQKVIEKIDSIK